MEFMTKLMLNIARGSSIFVSVFASAQQEYNPELAYKDASQTILQQQREQNLQSQVQPQSDIRLDYLNLNKNNQDYYLSSDRESVCFEIKQFVLQGDEAERFRFALRKITHGQYNLIGRCIGAKGLEQALNLVQNEVITKGYVTSRLLFPAQNVASGKIYIQVIPGRIDQLRLSEGTSDEITLWNALPLQAGDVLNIHDIEQGLENFKRVPTVDIDFSIQLAQHNTAPGYSDVILSWQQKRPYRLNLTVDDSGSDSTGKYQGSATLSLDHLFQMNDLFYASYNHDLGGGDSGRRGSEGFYLSYTVPYHYWLLNLNYAQSDYHQNVAGSSEDYLYSGESQQINLGLSRLIYRDAKRKTTLNLGAWYRDSNNYINDTEVEVQRRKTAGWQAGIEHTEYLPYATLNASINYKRGTAMLNAQPAPEQDFGEGSSRVGILQANANLQVPFNIAQQPFQYLIDWRVQNSQHALTPQDRFSIGNRYTVRGFNEEQTLLGDQGLVIRNEISTPLPTLRTQLYAGVDYGEVGGRSTRQPNPLVGTSLMGAALGVRGQLFSQFYYDAFIATPLYKPTSFQTDALTSGFSVNWSY